MAGDILTHQWNFDFCPLRRGPSGPAPKGLPDQFGMIVLKNGKHPFGGQIAIGASEIKEQINFCGYQWGVCHF
jgi:hypothetical protein